MRRGMILYKNGFFVREIQPKGNIEGRCYDKSARREWRMVFVFWFLLSRLRLKFSNDDDAIVFEHFIFMRGIW